MPMTGRERVRRCLTFQNPDRPPRDLWFLPGIQQERSAELQQVLDRFPVDVTSPPARYGESLRAKGTPNQVGTYRDAWGSVWEVKQSGIIGEVKIPALADWSQLAHYQPPWELLNRNDRDEINRACDESDLFMKPGTWCNPFERMQFLRGSENLFIDIGYRPKELYQLRDMIHEFNLKDLELWARTEVDGLAFADDWGTQHALLVSPAFWREFYKPLYRDYVNIIHSAGKFAFFHSDGFIEDIYPDLIEIGVDAVNSQIFCMNIEELARCYKGKITFWGEIDRQNILPFGTLRQVQDAVHRVRAAFDDGSGGVFAQCEWGIGVPMENILAVFEAWE